MKPLGTGDPLRLGPYRLLGVLGEGGMGKVYVGQDAVGTVAAVKVLRPELTDEANLARRFVREAQAATAVTSKGVARVLGTDTEGGRPWIATEFLAGPTLDEAVEAYGPLDEPAVRALAASIAHTLADIHNTGLIHRDLKPPNIVLTSAGPRVIDFGIARPEHGLTLTSTGQVPVTPGYGAPEQVLGRRVASSADVFSLGAVLVYAASGHRAYDASHIAALQYKVVHDAPDLTGVPEALRHLIAPCLAKDPAARPAPAQIAAAFAPPRGAERAWRRGPVNQAIKERESGLHELTAATLPDGGSGRPVPRRRLLTGLAAGGAVLAAGGGAAAVWWPRGPRQPAGRPDLFAFPPAARTPVAHVLDADNGDYLAGGEVKPLWGPVDVLAEDTPAPLPVRDVIVLGARGGGIAAHNVVDGKRRWAVRDVSAPSRYLSLSDRLIAAADTKGTLRTFIASTGEPRWTVDAEASVLLAADDESVYVLTKDHRLRAVRCSDATIRWTAKIAAGYRTKVEPPGVVAHGRLILGTSDGNVFAVDTADGHQVWELRDQWDRLVRPAVHGTTVYLNGTTLTARRIRDGKKLWSLDKRDAWDKHEDWGPATVFDDDTVCAAHDEWPSIRKTRDGSEIQGGNGTSIRWLPVFIHGRALWSIEGDPWFKVFAADLSTGVPVLTYKLPAAERSWLVADGNRVFVLHGTSLYALPVP
ncbi:serine/threonine-protein kinase [Streptomyces decoyicus]|uniref:serine/threonine-protein kinase n=1 Tax=Streptomyces decoyicus TaxID=249567 RepID=UPI002E3459BE|nr:PQQ-binding-like beta-propeller repeat protein [Streptomyces decoyicus]